ncbi:MAG TPA: protein-glutamate O-methyltransferase CheR [Bdellovibrionales bacterium]|nr:protein-glutamate O-methyltransferase CheR [Bdellovibrionales bacterium]
MKLDSGDYAFFSQYLKNVCGIELGDDKQYLLEARLTPLLQRFSFKSLGELIAALKAAPAKELVRAVIEAMVTNESLFFRDVGPFDSLCLKILPQLLAQKGHERTLRIWSAACSTGQEPYSVVMALTLHMNVFATHHVEIFCSDISSAALDRAREGTYSEFEVQRGLTPGHLARFFHKTPGGWRVNDELRAALTFKQLNLLEPPPAVGPFDLILCRNVLIYFDRDTKVRVLANLEHAMAPWAFLFLGATESLLGISERFERMESCSGPVYRRGRGKAG